MTHGDGFAPHPTLEAFSRQRGGMFYYDTLQWALNDPTIVLIHGNGDEADTWRHIVPALSETHRVIAPDLPGFGRSAPRESGDITALAAGVRGLIEAEGLSRVALVGSSLGASVASAVAVALPSVSSLTIIGGTVPGLPGVQPEINPGLQAMLEPGVGEAYYTGLRDQGQDAAYASLQPYYANLSGLSASDQAFLRERVWARVWSDTQRTAFFAALRSMWNPSELSSRLETIPLQLIWGERDQIIPISVAHDILAALPHTKLEVIEGAGHLPHQEQPEPVLSILNGFLG
jgi:pimeloyl-ACP methyl ester carboxylesterase